MPTGEGQTGKRRGPYGGKRAAAPPKWTAEDKKHFAQLVEESPLASEPAKANAARRATELARQLRELDGRPRTVDEEKALIAASSQYRHWLEVLKVTEKIVEDDEPL